MKLRTEGTASGKAGDMTRVRPEGLLSYWSCSISVVGCLFYSSSLSAQTHFIYIIYMYYIIKNILSTNIFNILSIINIKYYVLRIY